VPNDIMCTWHDELHITLGAERPPCQSIAVGTYHWEKPAKLVTSV